MQNRLKSSAAEIKNIHSLVTCAVCVALYVAINSLSFYVTPSLKLTFSFLILGMIGYRFGLITGSLAAVACDLVAYVIRPAGPLHLGFTLSTVLTVAVFAIFFYGHKITVWRAVVSRAFINLAINIALNTYWLSNLYGEAYHVLLLERFIKNIALLPIEAILLYFVLNAFKTVIEKSGYR